MDKDLLEHSLTLVGAGDPDFTVRFYDIANTFGVIVDAVTTGSVG